MAFPYWKYSLDSADIMFDHLLNQIILTESTNSDTVVFRTYPEDYTFCDRISDHFTESIRIQCRFADYPTPMEIWTTVKNDPTIKKLSKHDKREHVYSLTKECNTFNPTYCMYIITELVGNNSKILDPSSGWGDRLIASLASKAAIYHGFDPNKLLQKAYKKIIKQFNSSNNEYSVRPIPFEDSELPINFYDLAITSPPYYNLEQYGSDSMQSIIRYNTYESWLTNFYKPYLQKMIDAVRVNGYIAIYIEDIISNKIKYQLRSVTINYMNNEHLKYYFKIGLKVGKSIRWTLIWQKIK